MCGIVGVIDGRGNAIKKIDKSLYSLEYRGYDSAGITFFNAGEFQTIKSVGAPAELFKKVKVQKTNVGIAHTRWATHGKVCESNAHPHVSAGGKFSLVHNGIIENYIELKNKYLQNVNFKSETDSEVVVNLLEKFYAGDVVSAIKKTITQLKGCFALAILCESEPNKIYFAKKDMSLLIGVADDEICLSSDVAAFSPNIKQYIEVANLSFGEVSLNGIKMFNFSGKKVDYKTLPLDENNRQANLGEFKHFMEKEIYEIPIALKNTLDFYAGAKNPLAKIDKAFFSGIKYVKILACGTSFHAGLVGQKLFEQTGILANAEIASEFIYNNSLLPRGTLAIFVSQSGETADTLAAARVAREKGAKTLAITNVAGSAIDKACDHSLYLKAGSERAVASTKAYNAQVLVFYLLSQFLQGEESYNNFVGELHEQLKMLEIKNMHNSILPLVNIVKNSNNVFVVGRNFDYVTSLEAALKIKEITYKNCEGFAAGELKHGTLALVENGTTIIAFITEKVLIDKTLNIVSQTKSRGANVVIVSPFDTLKMRENCEFLINVANFSEAVMPLFSIIPIQLLAYETSLALNINPDKPRNLAKSVTVE